MFVGLSLVRIAKSVGILRKPPLEILFAFAVDFPIRTVTIFVTSVVEPSRGTH